jgi:isopenicillin-N N-acyltransferase-like protein
MIHLNTSGSAHEIGLQHGIACREAIRLAYEAFGLAYDPFYQNTGGSKGETQIDTAVRIVHDRLRRFFPKALEEVQGIADGAHLSPRQVLMRNGASDVASLIASLGCSTLGFVDSDFGVLLGKTSDWNVDSAEDFLMWQRYQPAVGEGHAFVHYTSAGMLWSEGGLNEVGLGLVGNGLPAVAPHLTSDSVPSAPIGRGVLQHCDDVEGALCFIQQYELISGGKGWMLADAGGDLAFIEFLPGAQSVHRPKQADCLFHTNHCLCPQTKARELNPTEDSLARYETLARIAPPAPRTLEGMKGLLRHSTDPGAISRGKTVCAMIIAPEHRKMWGAEGYPPDVDFVEYDV